MAKAFEVRAPRRRAVAPGTAFGLVPPEGPGPIPGGLPGDGPIVGEVRQHQKEAPALPDGLIEVGIDFTGDAKR